MAYCRHCITGICVKAGIQKSRKQRYKCKACRKYQQADYSYKSYNVSDGQICNHVKEGVGIRGTSRLLSINPNTVISRIRKIAKDILAPVLFKANLVYEMDEMHTFIRKKGNDCWIIYAIERSTRQVIDFRLGRRTKSKLKQVIESVLYCKPKRIYTDRLNIYPNLIPNKKHRISQYGTNIIERHT